MPSFHTKSVADSTKRYRASALVLTPFAAVYEECSFSAFLDCTSVLAFSRSSSSAPTIAGNSPLIVPLSFSALFTFLDQVWDFE